MANKKDNSNLLRDRVASVVAEAFTSLGLKPESGTIKLEYARDEKFGDYACTSAMDKDVRMRYAAIVPEWKNPRAFASAIIEELKNNAAANALLENIEIAGPGFINLRVSDDTLWEELKSALVPDIQFGTSRNDNPRKIIFEFVSANPTGPLNVVSARAAALGDCCCNLLEAAGDEVYREYYVNDFGNQANLLGISILLRFYEDQGIKLKFAKKDSAGIASYESGPGLPFPAEGYHGEYLKDIGRNIIQSQPELKPGASDIKNIGEIAKQKNVSPDFIQDPAMHKKSVGLGQMAMEHFLNSHKRDLEIFRVRFDNYYSERSLHESGAVLKAKDDLASHLHMQDGKTFFKSTEYGDDKDRVIIRDDGRPTYLLADIAYHKSKIERGYDYIYDIWGPDHHGYIKRLQGAMKAMDFSEDRFRVIIAQQVNLLDQGKPIVMSKRTGKFITMADLLNEIPPDVSRYFFVMRSFDSHLDFDYAEARDTSEKNPYYYVAYAHARIRSIFVRCRTLDLLEGDESDLRNFRHRPALSAERRKLLWLTARFPEEVRDAARNLEPHRLIAYIHLIAAALSRFYGPRENKIIEQNKETAEALLAILAGTAACLKNGLELLGMNAPERMDREPESETETES